MKSLEFYPLIKIYEHAVVHLFGEYKIFYGAFVFNNANYNLDWQISHIYFWNEHTLFFVFTKHPYVESVLLPIQFSRYHATLNCLRIIYAEQVAVHNKLRWDYNLPMQFYDYKELITSMLVFKMFGRPAIISVHHATIYGERDKMDFSYETFISLKMFCYVYVLISEMVN